MIINASKLIGCPVLSLHVGGPVGRVAADVVDPNDLKVIAYRVNGPLVRGEVGDLLQTSSVRELSNIGMIIDSLDDLVKSGDVIKLDEILALNFSLLGLKVETKKGTKLGKVIDYTIDTTNFMMVQLVVRRPAMKALIDPELIIARSQITEVNDYKIIVKDEEEKIRRDARKKDFVPNFVNPFREPSFSQARMKTPGSRDTE